MEKERIGKYEFLAEPFHCDFNYRLFMGHMGNHMLNAADFHATANGFGMDYLLPNRRAWVLSRLAIEMEEMPTMYTRFYVETWVESVMRFFTNRNFRVVGTDGRVFGYGRAVWALVDLDTRKPTDLLLIPGINIADRVVKDKPCLMEKASRVKMSTQAELVRTIETYYSDIDINGHVNSVKYIEHVLDLWPGSWHKDHPLHRFEVAYVAEGHQGDRISFYREQVNDLTFCVRISREDGTELSRCQLEFA